MEGVKFLCILLPSSLLNLGPRTFYKCSGCHSEVFKFAVPRRVGALFWSVRSIPLPVVSRTLRRTRGICLPPGGNGGLASDYASDYGQPAASGRWRDGTFCFRSIQSQASLPGLDCGQVISSLVLAVIVVRVKYNTR